MIASPQLFSFRQKIGFLRSHAQFLAPWPVACGALMTGLWLWAVPSIYQEKNHIQERAYMTAAAQARIYADQIERTISQLDYILLSLKFQWQKNGGVLNLEEQVDAGLVPKATKISVTVLDRSGIPVTTTSPKIKTKKSVALLEYFRIHAANPSQDLAISKPVRSALTGREVLLLSRRLDGEKGAFAGVIVIAIEPSTVVSFVDETKLGEADFVAIYSADGNFLSAKTKIIQTQSSIFKAKASFDVPNGKVYRPASEYEDGKARIVAWNKVGNYPIVAMVGLAETTIAAEYEQRYRKILLIATTGSLALFLIAAAGMRQAAFRIWKAQYAREVHEAYRTATENAREGFYILRPLFGQDKDISDFLIEDCNEQGAAYRGLPRESLIGKRLSVMLPALFESHMLAACREAMNTGFVEDEMLVPQHGARAAQWLQRRLVRSSAGLAVTLRDITEIKRHEEALVQSANIDPLTSLRNRYWLINYLPEAIDLARDSHKVFAVLFVDLDDFKNINDTLGHAVGDELLKAAASRLKAAIRPEDKVARLGGDEFTIIVESAQSREEVAAVAERIINTLQSPFVLGDGDRQYYVHASIGISMFPENGADGQSLLKHADIAMYAAKESQKGSYRFFEPSLERRLITRINREAELKVAIEQRELVLHYQPKIKGDTGEITGMEALVRWNHPKLGCLPPIEFIPLAEKAGLIVRLGNEVVRMACEQMALWREQGLAVVPVAINVSAQQINAGSISTVLASALRANGLGAELIEVEITESATVTEGGGAVAELAAIQKAGTKLYVDDFGTGYSCLAQLKRLDMDALKIDRAFTSQLLDGPDEAALFKAIVSMAHALRMRVVAEGVETAEQMAALQALSCDELQGYFISKPVPAADAARLLQKRFLFSDQ
jgi:diguanylate cyclase (GGDEF)-like protein